MNLIPTPIVDKNGVFSTRNKRPEEASFSRIGKMKAPILSIPESPEETDEEEIKDADIEAREAHVALIGSLTIKGGFVEMGGERLDRYFTFYSDRGTKITIDGMGRTEDIIYYIDELKGNRKVADSVTATPSETVDFIRANYTYDGDKDTYEKTKMKADASRSASKERSLSLQTKGIREASSMSPTQFDNWFESEAAARGLKRSRY